MNDKDFMRFITKVKIGDECWEWIGVKNKKINGYGQFSIKSKMVMAHRFAWSDANNQKIPNNMVICHSCDNPACVRPGHLFIGSQSDNMKDAWNKGRVIMPDGIRDSKKFRKLTKKDVVELRHLWRNKKFEYGDRLKFFHKCSKKYGVSYRTIENIVYGIGWKDAI